MFTCSGSTSMKTVFRTVSPSVEATPFASTYTHVTSTLFSRPTHASGRATPSARRTISVCRRYASTASSKPACPCLTGLPAWRAAASSRSSANSRIVISSERAATLCSAVVRPT